MVGVPLSPGRGKALNLRLGPSKTKPPNALYPGISLGETMSNYRIDIVDKDKMEIVVHLPNCARIKHVQRWSQETPEQFAKRVYAEAKAYYTELSQLQEIVDRVCQENTTP